MIKLFDRVKVNIPTTGTGDITFGAAVSTAFLTPTEAGVLDGDEVRYVIVDGLDFEEGVGLIKDTVATMERTVTKSKIGGVVGTSPINLSGTAVLALTASAADIGDSANHTYDNSVSGLDSGNVQDAIDEVASRDFVVPHLFGLTLSNSVSDPDNDVDIAPGQASAIDLSATLKLTSAITKRLDAAWAAGSGNGGLDTGSAASNTTYHLWLIRRSDTGVVDALFSTSATNPVLPSNYDGKRRIGAVMTDGDGDIIPFRQVGGWFHFVGNGVGMIISEANVSTATNIALPVPQGIKVLADFGLAISSNSTDTGGIFIGARDPDTGAATVYDIVVLGLKGTDGNQVQCWTNTAAQVSFFGSKSGTKILIYPRGFYDGRDTYV